MTNNCGHGGNRRAFAAKYGIPESEVIDFSSNSNPWGPPESILRVFQESSPLLSRYPDPESGLLKKEVARNYPLWPENVIAGNGSTELIHLLVQFLKPRKALLIEPAFSEYRRALNLQGTEVRGLLLREKNEFQINTAELLNAAQGVDMIFLCNPNNPTGAVLPRAEILTLIESLRRRGIFLVLDEAFVDWVPEEGLASALTDQSSFFILRSLTKFYSLSGIRIGYGLGARRLIEKLENAKVTWSVNHLAEILAVEALRDLEFQRKSRQLFHQEKDFLSGELSAIEELKVFPSAANFFLIKLKNGMRAGELTEKLAAEKIMIRDAANFVGLDNQFFRVAVARREENQLLVKALRRIFEASHAAS